MTCLGSCPWQHSLTLGLVCCGCTLYIYCNPEVVESSSGQLAPVAAESSRYMTAAGEEEETRWKSSEAKSGGEPACYYRQVLPQKAVQQRRADWQTIKHGANYAS